MSLDIEIKVKKYRKEKGMTLSELSKKSGISISFLSQIENGKTAMTLVTLSRIAKALEIPMKELFEEKEYGDEYVRPKNGYVLSGMQHNYKTISVLSGRFNDRKLEAFHMTMEPNFHDFEELEHPGEEFFYVLRGRGSFLINGVVHEIEAGETIHFPSTISHKVLNRNDEELEMICVMTPRMF